MARLAPAATVCLALFPAMTAPVSARIIEQTDLRKLVSSAEAIVVARVVSVAPESSDQVVATSVVSVVARLEYPARPQG
jgi:hypothetical protein